MSKDVIKLPVVLVVLVGSAFNVEIHKNAVQGIDRHWLGFGHLHSLPLVCGITRSAAPCRACRSRSTPPRMMTPWTESLRTGRYSRLPQQAAGYQECASAGMATTSATTISNISRINRTG